jgi:hypothetical protein
LIGALLLNVVLTSEAKPALSSNRYLFIVETSRSMQKRTDGVKQAVTNLLGSGMRGQLQAGDTVGLWTYNNKLHAGMFPLQDWTPEKREALTSRVLLFLGAEKYEKSPAFHNVISALDPIIENSDFLTIVIISAGDEKIAGTPFDERINNDYKLWHDQQQKARMPFITILRANHGKITDSLVTPAPFQPDLPPLPKPVVAQKAMSASLPIPAPAPRIAEPLIISGHKSTAMAQTGTTLDSGTTTQTAATNSLVGGTAQKPSAPVTENFAPNLPTVVTVPQTVVSTGIVSRQSLPATAPLARPPVAASAATTNPAQTSQARTDAGDTFLRSEATARQAPALPVKVYARESSPTSDAAGSAATEATLPVLSLSVFSPRFIWGGLILTGLAVGMVFVFARKTRSPAPVSLITRSLERDRK